jgi:hypothetical protein
MNGLDFVWGFSDDKETFVMKYCRKSCFLSNGTGRYIFLNKRIEMGIIIHVRLPYIRKDIDTGR